MLKIHLIILDHHLGKLLTFIAWGTWCKIRYHVYSGYVIPPNYDSMIAKLIVTSQTREEAIDKMRRALMSL